MKDKHYDIDYLKNTRRLLQSLKEQSYSYFKDINSGDVVDLGCGTGNDVIELAKLLGNNVNVIGVDHDQEMLNQGKKASIEFSNADFLLSEAYPLPFGDESVSGLRTERMIQHLKDPETVIQEIYRILKAGNPFVAIETDWSSLSFYTRFVEIEKRVNGYLTNVKVNNGFAAKELISYLKYSNFRDIKFEIHPFVIDTLEDANEYFWIEKILKEAVQKKIINENEYQDFYGALETADDEGYFSCSINLVIASCIK